MLARSLLVAMSSAALADAADPAGGWMAYGSIHPPHILRISFTWRVHPAAVGQVPAGTQRITKLDMKWKVGGNAKPSGSFYSPWFGMDPADELNLIQPVNPWIGRE
jgi:hypothetical protein